jgi:hypothetical protein
MFVFGKRKKAKKIIKSNDFSFEVAEQILPSTYMFSIPLETY